MIHVSPQGTRIMSYFYIKTIKNIVGSLRVSVTIAIVHYV